MAEHSFWKFGSSRALAALVLASLAACGGGGGGGGGGGSPPPPDPKQPAAAAHVLSVSPLVVLFGGEITITGQHLDAAAAYYVDETPVPIKPGTAGSSTVTLLAPSARVAGRLYVADAAGMRRPSSFTVAIYEPVIASGFAPARTYTGRAVSITGNGLDTVTGVRVSGVAAPIASQSPTELTAIVPASASTGPIELATPYGIVAAAGKLEILPTVVASGVTAVRSSGQTGIVITGSHLDKVQAVHVGAVRATITAQQPGQLAAAVSNGVEGIVRLDAGAQGEVVAGTVATAAAAQIVLAPIEILQGYAVAGNDLSLRLTANKPAAIRAVVTTDRADVPSPVVTLTAHRAGVVLGSRPMSGPARLPQAVAAVDLNNAFIAAVPAAWMVAGVTFTVDASIAGLTTVQSAQPSIGAPTRIDLVLVPMIVNGIQGQVPPTEEVAAEVARMLPYPPDSIRVSVGAAFVVPATHTLETLESAAAVLNLLEQRRRQEAPDKYYYGFFDGNSLRTRSAVAGLGHLGSATWVNASATSAIGIDSTPVLVSPQSAFGHALRSSIWTMLHELGHNHSLMHAPCGNAAGPDPSYPYPDGALGPRILHTSSYQDGDPGRLASPTYLDADGKTVKPATDVMGYCGGSYLSDFHFNKAGQFAEAFSAAFPTQVKAMAKRTASNEPERHLLVSGSIMPAGIVLYPVTVSSVAQPTPRPAASDWVLRLRTEAGATMDIPFVPTPLSVHADGHYAFFVSLPDTGPLAAIEVLHRNAVLNVGGGRPRAQGASNLAATGPEPKAQSFVDVTVERDTLTVRWNGEAEPYIDVVHVADDGQRTVLALRSTGGTYSANVAHLKGGRFELSVSTGLAARLLTVAR